MPRALRNRAIQAAQDRSSALRSCLTSAASLMRILARLVVPIAAGIMLRAQHPMQNLAGSRPRHLLLADERDRSRPLVTGDAILAPFEDFVRRWRLTIPGNDHGMHALAPLCVADADDRHILHLRMAAQQRFDLGGIYVLTTGDDHVALAVDQINVALFVAAGHVADRTVAAAKGLLGLLRQFPVAVERIGIARI